ncbi:Protein FAR1-RELATED SEQUENCE 5, partial [Bienertia sinuspersici]
MRGSLVGYVIETLGEINELYRKYSTLVGFSIRKSTIRKIPKTGELEEQYFVCSCHGLGEEGPPKDQTPISNENDNKKRKEKKQAITRTKCKAQTCDKKNKEGLFEILHHVTNHNHKLTRLPWQHFHRSERHINGGKAKTIQTLQEAGIGPADSYRYLGAAAGGEQYVGHTLKDHMDLSYRLKIKEIK